jgi:hypothetical protein
MRPYMNLSGNSGVLEYDVGPEFIEVRFRGGASYVYSYRGVGRENVERMKALAGAGRGLSTFISQNPSVRDGYDPQ